MLDGHMIDYAPDKLYTKGCRARGPAALVHGPFGTEIGCTLPDTTWYDAEYYTKKLGGQQAGSPGSWKAERLEGWKTGKPES